jgi:hypothetical protein
MRKTEKQISIIKVLALQYFDPDEAKIYLRAVSLYVITSNDAKKVI